MLSPTAGDAERPAVLAYIEGLRFIRIEAFDTEAAVTAGELLRCGPSGPAVHAARPTGRYLFTLTPNAYAGTGVQAVHPDQ